MGVFYENRLNMRHQMEQRLAVVLSARVNAYLEQIFSEPINAVNTVARLYSSGKLNSANIESQARQLATVAATMPELTAINIGFEDGRHVGVDRSLFNGVLHTSVVASGSRPYRDVYSVSEDGQRDLFIFRDPNVFVPTTRSWYRSAVLRGKGAWYPMYRYAPSEISDQSGNFGMGYSMPVYDDHKKIVGAINSDIALGQVSHYLSLLPLGEGGVVFIANDLNQIVGISNNTPLIHAQENQSDDLQLARFNNTDSPLIHAAGERLLKAGTGSSYLNLQGAVYIEDVRDFKTSTGLTLKLVVLVPETQFFPTIRSDLTSMLLFVLVALLIGIALVFLVAFRLSKPIIEMTKWAEKLSRGNWDALNNADEKIFKEYPVKEIRQLRKSLSTMANSLHEIVATLEERVAERTAELELVNSNLFELSNTDGLTGIPNRRKFDEVLASEWNRATRTGQPLVVALIDVDWFKKFNDHNGHLAGDDCLRTVANILKAKVRRSSDLVARYGGEEFAIISPGINKVNAVEMANIICSAIAEANLPHAVSPFGMITVSIGVALIVPGLNIAPETLIKAADEALYHAKESGRNQVISAEIETAPKEKYSGPVFKFEQR